MEWFKHDANANMDKKMQEVLLDYGLEGYGLYFYCLELIAGKIGVSNLTFELEHDSRIIAKNTGSTTQKVSEMMSRFIELGLFENDNGRVTCFKMLSRLDTSMTGNSKFRQLIQDKKQDHDGVMTQSCKKRTEKNRIEQKEAITEILNHLNNRTKSKFENVESNSKLIRARLNEAHSKNKIIAVIDSKVDEWLNDKSMSKYLRPKTLFSAENFNQYAGQLSSNFTSNPLDKLSYDELIAKASKLNIENAETLDTEILKELIARGES